jgi:tetratricopeptide (TPR) repeat protein
MISHPLRKNYFLFTLIIPIIMIILSYTVSFADADKIFKENNKAVVVIETFDKEGKPLSQGSGFIVRENGAIVTNYHVISNAEDIKVKVGDKVLEVEGLLHIDKENDVVILKAKGKDLQSVKIGDIEKLSVGEKVYVISSPQGLKNTISDGILSGIRNIDSQRKILQITAPVSEGSSGGPVFNKDGEVIGIATFIIKEAQNISFAIPVNLIRGKFSGQEVILLEKTTIKDFTGTAEYWFYRGVAYGNSGMLKEAINAYEHAIRIVPNFANAYFNLGVIYDKLDLHNEAIDAYKQAIRIKPDHAEAYYNLGFSYQKLSRFEEAAKAYKETIKINPDNSEAHNNLGLIYGILGMPEESFDAFKQAVRIRPDNAQAHYNIGLYYTVSGNRGSALEEYKILKDLDVELANKLFNLIYK